MKKLCKIIGFILVLFITVVPLSACNEKDYGDFWTKTNTKFNSYIELVTTSDEYKNGIVFGKNISAIIEKSSEDEFYDYYQLDNVYNNFFISVNNTIKPFKDIFTVPPKQQTSAVYKKYTNFNKEIDQTIKDLENFSKITSNLETKFNSTDNEYISEQISLQYIKDYKRDFLELLNSLNNLNTSIVNILTSQIYTSYNSVDETTENVELFNIANISKLSANQKIIDSLFNYIKIFNGEYTILAFDKSAQILDSVNNLNYNTTPNYKQVLKFKTIIKYFNTSTANFLSSLKVVDFDVFKLDYNFNLEEYKKVSQNLLVNLTNIENFLSNDLFFVMDCLNNL